MIVQSSYRAAPQPITHDEACTYNWFVASPANIFNYDPNNHVPSTYLAMGIYAALCLPPAGERQRAPTRALQALCGRPPHLGTLFALAARHGSVWLACRSRLSRR